MQRHRGAPSGPAGLPGNAPPPPPAAARRLPEPRPAVGPDAARLPDSPPPTPGRRCPPRVLRHWRPERALRHLGHPARRLPDRLRHLRRRHVDPLSSLFRHSHTLDVHLMARRGAAPPAEHLRRALPASPASSTSSTAPCSAARARGQTVGMMAVGVRAVRTRPSQGRLGYGRAFARALVGGCPAARSTSSSSSSASSGCSTCSSRCGTRSARPCTTRWPVGRPPGPPGGLDCRIPGRITPV